MLFEVKLAIDACSDSGAQNMKYQSTDANMILSEFKENVIDYNDQINETSCLHSDWCSRSQSFHFWVKNPKIL